MSISIITDSIFLSTIFSAALHDRSILLRSSHLSLNTLVLTDFHAVYTEKRQRVFLLCRTDGYIRLFLLTLHFAEMKIQLLHIAIRESVTE